MQHTLPGTVDVYGFVSSHYSRSRFHFRSLSGSRCQWSVGSDPDPDPDSIPVPIWTSIFIWTLPITLDRSQAEEIVFLNKLTLFSLESTASKRHPPLMAKPYLLVGVEHHKGPPSMVLLECWCWKVAVISSYICSV